MSRKKSTIIFEGQDKPRADKNRHYVNNKDFYHALVERNALLKEAEEQGDPPPRVSEYIGECIYSIATNLSNKSQFMNYPYKDEMVSDAIHNCLKGVDKFDVEKYSNPFAYFTQIAYFAFISRIESEKTQLYIRFKSTSESVALGDLADTSSDASHMMDNLDIEQEYMDDYVDKFEEKHKLGEYKKTKRKSKQKGHSILDYAK